MANNIGRPNEFNATMQSQNDENIPGSAGLLDWLVSYQPDRKVVLLQTSGPIDKNSFSAMITAAVATAERQNCVSILGDHRNSSLNLDPLEIYYSPKVMIGSGLDSRYFIAMAFPQMTEDIQFMENVCRNSGLQLSVHPDIEAAHQWLTARSTSVESPCQFATVSTEQGKQ